MIVFVVMAHGRSDRPVKVYRSGAEAIDYAREFSERLKNQTYTDYKFCDVTAVMMEDGDNVFKNEV